MSQLTTVYTLSYTSSIFMILLSAMVLKEKLSWEKWFAVCFGLIGIIIAIQPGSTIFEWGALLILFGTFLGALNKILMRKLSQTEPVWAITIYPNLLMVIVTLPFLFYSWQPMPWEHWALFGGVGLIASLGQYLIAEALRYTQGSILAPIDYSTFFWVMAIDHFLWQKGVASHYLIGAAIIIVSNLFIVYYSRKTASQSLNSVK